MMQGGKERKKLEDTESFCDGMDKKILDKCENLEKAKEFDNEKKLRQSKMDQEKLQKPKEKNLKIKSSSPRYFPLISMKYLIGVENSSRVMIYCTKYQEMEIVGLHVDLLIFSEMKLLEHISMNCEIIKEREYYINKGY